jgi:hypothetical protein
LALAIPLSFQDLLFDLDLDVDFILVLVWSKNYTFWVAADSFVLLASIMIN